MRVSFFAMPAPRNTLARWARRAASCTSLTLLAALSAYGQPSDQAADEEAIRAVVQAFVAEREADDPSELAALLTADVDQVLTSGRARSGRDAVVAGSLSTTRTTGGQRTIELDRIRFITPDVAIADGPYNSLGRADGTDLRMRTSIVLLREDGRWRIAAIRNMVPVGN